MSSPLSLTLLRRSKKKNLSRSRPCPSPVPPTPGIEPPVRVLVTLRERVPTAGAQQHARRSQRGRGIAEAPGERKGQGRVAARREREGEGVAVAPRRGESSRATREEAPAGADGRGGEEGALRLAAAGEDDEASERRRQQSREQSRRRRRRQERERGQRGTSCCCSPGEEDAEGEAGEREVGGEGGAGLSFFCCCRRGSEFRFNHSSLSESLFFPLSTDSPALPLPLSPPRHGAGHRPQSSRGLQRPGTRSRGPFWW